MAKAKEKYIETLRSQKVDQLKKMLLDEREAQFSNRIKHKTGQLNERHLLRESKTKIAQIKTVINEKNNEETKS
jgi:ribosomal protein L29